CRIRNVRNRVDFPREGGVGVNSDSTLPGEVHTAQRPMRPSSGKPLPVSALLWNTLVDERPPAAPSTPDAPILCPSLPSSARFALAPNPAPGMILPSTRPLIVTQGGSDDVRRPLSGRSPHRTLAPAGRLLTIRPRPRTPPRRRSLPAAPRPRR